MKPQLLSMNTLPVGTEVYYEGTYGVVKFVCEQYITVCTHINTDPLRNVCICIIPSQQHKLELANGNHAHEP
jgi:hypothetical protein